MVGFSLLIFLDECIGDNALSEVVFQFLSRLGINLAYSCSLFSAQLCILRPGLSEDWKIGVGRFP